MSDTAETAVELKKLYDLNLQALAYDFARVLTKHVDGKFEISLTKLEHTKPGSAFGDKMILHLLVNDKSDALLDRRFREKVGFFAESDAENKGQ